MEPDDDVKEAADLMASRQIRRLPVVQEGKLIGMLALGDIAVKHEEGTASYALEGVSEGVKGPRAEGGPARSEAKSTAAGSPSAAAKGRTTRKKTA